jgi:eukaryotic-like serine/threonine-protein kinase
VDFGIAKAIAANQHTTDSLKGKLAYMSPEQCRAEPLDRRSDLFSLGVVLYEMTTGVLPFPSISGLELMNSLSEAKYVPPAKAKAGYPEELAAIVAQAMAKLPSDRFQTAQHFQEALESYAREHRIEVSSISLSRWLRSLFAESSEQTDTPLELEPSLEEPTGNITRPFRKSPGSAPNVAAVARPRRMLRWSLVATVALGLAGWAMALRLTGNSPEVAPPPDRPVSVAPPADPPPLLTPPVASPTSQPAPAMATTPPQRIRKPKPQKRSQPKRPNAPNDDSALEPE